jgi:hypothetical protein
MDHFQEEQTFLQNTEQQWETVTAEHRRNEASLAEVTRIRDQLESEKNGLTIELSSSIRSLKEKLTNKIRMVKQIHLYFNQVMEQQKRDRAFVPTQETLYSQEDLDKLAFTCQNPLKFDSLVVKRGNFGKETERKTSSLR